MHWTKHRTLGREPYCFDKQNVTHRQAKHMTTSNCELASARVAGKLQESENRTAPHPAYRLGLRPTHMNRRVLTKKSVSDGFIIADATKVVLRLRTPGCVCVYKPAFVSVLAIARCVELADLRLVIWSQALGGTMKELALITGVASVSRVAATWPSQSRSALRRGWDGDSLIFAGPSCFGSNRPSVGESSGGSGDTGCHGR